MDRGEGGGSSRDERKEEVGKHGALKLVLRPARKDYQHKQMGGSGGGAKLLCIHLNSHVRH